jgi:hypothetical protein
MRTETTELTELMVSVTAIEEPLVDSLSSRIESASLALAA